jgi:hypothetical protein
VAGVFSTSIAPPASTIAVARGAPRTRGGSAARPPRSCAPRIGVVSDARVVVARRRRGRALAPARESRGGDDDDDHDDDGDDATRGARRRRRGSRPHARAIVDAMCVARMERRVVRSRLV